MQSPQSFLFDFPLHIPKSPLVDRAPTRVKSALRPRNAAGWAASEGAATWQGRATKSLGFTRYPSSTLFPFLFGGSEYYTLILEGLLGNLV